MKIEFWIGEGGLTYLLQSTVTLEISNTHIYLTIWIDYQFIKWSKHLQSVDRVTYFPSQSYVMNLYRLQTIHAQCSGTTAPDRPLITGQNTCHTAEKKNHYRRHSLCVTGLYKSIKLISVTRFIWHKQVLIVYDTRNRWCYLYRHHFYAAPSLPSDNLA